MQLKHIVVTAGVVAAQCELGCIDVVEPVCASDGKTYNNSCLVKVAACSEKKNITVVAQSDCKVCSNRICTSVGSPVCGSDGKTYANSCELGRATCKNASITLASNGWCEESGNSTCKTGCIALYKPVCASNGETYGNDCELKNAACDNSSITKVSDGECTGESNSTNTTKAPSTTAENSVSSTTESPKTTASAPTTTATKSASATVIASVATTIFVAVLSFLA
ncbi:unnamed protein product [Aphanomyces euteiches]|uniref:Kazal-like domain-containing protein n=1 Tax=Aphanomyces euteiches TaxID=100861 RepID=A0A6G0X6H7_9STRA|nr:hypothetical protein Ae201684_008118 [Aphanomyces euteiches]KAH9074434.1 hypothetical protein Ae201684P_022241 [Aphanomyces euteiches]KAH9146025.1 hypothetical protein AeRB84_010083 [Aphanomyces euteiches]